MTRNTNRSKSNMELQLFIQPDSLELIFKNNGHNTIKIWEFHNSWGWHTIFLQLKKMNSNEEFTLTKLKQIGWTKNFPSFIEIHSRESHKLNIFPREKGWESEKDLSVLKNLSLMVKAVLEIPETPEAKEFGIFVGKVESEWLLSEPPHLWLFKEN